MEISLIYFAVLFSGIALALAATDANGHRAGETLARAALALAAVALSAVAVFAFPGWTPLIVAMLALAGAAEVIFRRSADRIPLAPVAIPTTLLALFIGLHFFKGLPFFEVYSKAVISERYPHPLTISGSFDKGFAGLIVLLVAMRWPNRSARAEGLSGWWRVPFVVGGLLCIALLSRVMRLDPKWPAGLVEFALSNALLTCAAEEALFRGVLYGLIRRWLPTSPLGGWICIAATTLVFVMVHRGSTEYLLMVGLVGIGCGWVRERTGHISAAFATHVSINLAHFLLLSYPMP
jgi:uncharacterized protein